MITCRRLSSLRHHWPHLFFPVISKAQRGGVVARLHRSRTLAPVISAIKAAYIRMGRGCVAGADYSQSVMIPCYFDVALRDLGLCLGAPALGRLSQEYSA